MTNDDAVEAMNWGASTTHWAQAFTTTERGILLGSSPRDVVRYFPICSVQTEVYPNIPFPTNGPDLLPHHIRSQLLAFGMPLRHCKGCAKKRPFPEVIL